MAVTFGSYSGHLCVGYTLTRATTPTGGNATASITPYIGTDGWGYDDDQTLNYTGDWSGSQTKHNSLHGGHSTHQVKPPEKSMAFSAKTVTGSPGETVSCKIKLSGSYIPSEQPEITVTFTLADVPSTQAAPTVTNITQSQARVNIVIPSAHYSPLLDIRYYIYDAPTGGTLVASYADSVVTNTYHDFTGLTPGTTYYADTRARNGMGYAEHSPRKAFTTTAAIAPNKPTAPVVSDEGDTTCTLTGSAPTTNGATITTIRFQVRKPDDTVVYDDLDSDYSNAVTGLTIGNSYKARYLVNSNNGPSEWSDDTNFSTTASVPEIPTALSVAAVPGGTQFSWGPPASDGGSAIIQYGLEVYSDDTYSTLEYSVLVSDPPKLADAGDLPTDQQLWWRVRAENSEGLGDYALGTSFYIATDGGIYYFPPDGGPAERAYMYYFGDDGLPVLVM
jgi:hypothetical protein